MYQLRVNRLDESGHTATETAFETADAADAFLRELRQGQVVYRKPAGQPAMTVIGSGDIPVGELVDLYVAPMMVGG